MTNFTRQYYYTIYGEQNDYAVTDAPLSINCCGTELITPSSKILATSRNDHYLIYMFEGTLNGLVAGRSITLNAGDIYCIPPNSFYDYHCLSECGAKYFWVHFTGCDVDEVLQAANITPLEKKYVSVLPDVIELYKSLFSEYLFRQPHYKYRSALILRNIFSKFSSETFGDIARPNKLYTSISYIHSHIDTEISIKELAEMEFISEGYYRALFRRVTGYAPNEYIAIHRINLACSLLLNTTQSIESISQSIGMKDRMYFQRFFKKHVGITPWRYRNRIKS